MCVTLPDREIHVDSSILQYEPKVEFVFLEILLVRV